jgi:2-deoxy-D-gluconate 3-dehydrogenase
LRVESLYRTHVALVTGATRGIGRAIAIELAKAGSKIIAVARTETLLNELSEEIKQQSQASIITIVGDISNISGIPQIVEKGINHFGHIDILVNNAGITKVEPVEDVTEATWDAIMSVNLKAAFFFAQAVGKYMIKQKHGKIINIGSEAGLLGLVDMAVYSSSKGGLTALSRALAAEWGKYNIQVNTLSPGSAGTEMTLPRFEDAVGREEILGRMIIKRLCEPEEIAYTVVFLASDGADMITGQAICVDGGSTAI